MKAIEARRMDMGQTKVASIESEKRKESTADQILRNNVMFKSVR